MTQSICNIRPSLQYFHYVYQPSFLGLWHMQIGQDTLNQLNFQKLLISLVKVLLTLLLNQKSTQLDKPKRFSSLKSSWSPYASRWGKNEATFLKRVILHCY